MDNSKTKVYVGMSGGVDSSVTAALLKEEGYDVTGVYMKNWSQDLPGMPCPWKEDYRDAKRVAVQLGIPFKMYDFEKEYKSQVVDYMVREYQNGNTPNPDIMCNQEVKFKLFLQTALDDGADMIATGHYAKTSSGKLFMAKDTNKDQTYFLYRVTSKALERTLFPLGNLTKPEIRQLALERNLVTAKKKESMGICFVGKVGIKEFLSQYIETSPGEIIDQHGTVVGRHDGAIYYTIGQRHGLQVGGGLPFYVKSKDMQQNKVFVTTDLDDENLWREQLTLTDMHFIDSEPQESDKLQVRLRHRAPLVGVESLHKGDDETFWELKLAEQVRAITPGQSAVIYNDDKVVGGGVVA